MSISELKHHSIVESFRAQVSWSEGPIYEFQLYIRLFGITASISSFIKEYKNHFTFGAFQGVKKNVYEVLGSEPDTKVCK